MVLKNAWLALVLAILVGGLLRFVGLTSFPPSLNWDEVSHAYNGWSLLETGQDQWGSPLPLLNFRAYGDYPTTLSLYGTVTSIAIFGPTDFAARFPGAMLGVLSIALAFGVGYYWKHNWRQGALMAFLVAFEPWTVFTSRQVLQSNWVVFLVFAFLMFFIRKRQIWSLLVLVVALFSYHNARIWVPLVCLVLIVAWKNKASRLISVAVVALSLLILLAPTSRARSGTVGILDGGAVATIEANRNSSTLPSAVKRIVYNRPVYLFEKITLNYLDYLSPRYLFRDGGTQYQFSLPKTGLLSYLDLPFFYLGALALLVEFPLLGLMFLLAPLPAAITQDRFAVVRSTIMIPFVMLAVSIGFLKLKKPRLMPVYVTLAMLLLVGYYRNYFHDYPKNYSQSWQYGYRQAVNFVSEHSLEYNQVIFTKRYGEPHEYLLWYGKIAPKDYLAKLRSSDVNWDYHDNWYWVNSIGLIHFVNDWEMPGKLLGPSLIVSSPDHPVSGKELKTIKFLDGTPAFIITSI